MTPELFAGMEAFLETFAPCGADAGASADAEPAPGLSDDDTVAGVFGVVADLDGKVDAEMADVLGEAGYILEALVAYAGDFVLITQDIRWRVFEGEARGFGVGAAVETGVDQGGVGDTAAGGEELSALTFELLCAGAAVVEDVGDDADGGDHAKGDCANLVGT
jgi:hypothetical protein